MNYSEVRNCAWTDDGKIMCEVLSADLGWIPFTASDDDPEEHCQQIYDEITQGLHGAIADYVAPEPIAPTQKEIDQASKLTGVEFEGVMCSATSQDMWGLASVKPWILAGNDVNFEFDNGNTLVLTASNVAAFEAVWIPFRSSFFS